jgi:hypothetical protein
MTKRPAKSREVVFVDGPWQGQKIKTKQAEGTKSLNIVVGGEKGHYKFGRLEAYWSLENVR